MTPGFGLAARYVVHTVGPVWRGGSEGEPELLASCYRRTLEVAAAAGAAVGCIPGDLHGDLRVPSRARRDHRGATRSGRAAESSTSFASWRSMPRRSPLRVYSPDARLWSGSAPLQLQRTRCSCSTADPLGAARRGTRGRGGRRSSGTAPRCAPCRGSRRSSPRPRSSSTGSKKLGQPVPDSNLVSDENSGASQQTHTYVPSSWQSQYSPVKARSVPALRAHLELRRGEARTPLVVGLRELVFAERGMVLLLPGHRRQHAPGRTVPSTRSVSARSFRRDPSRQPAARRSRRRHASCAQATAPSASPGRVADAHRTGARSAARPGRRASASTTPAVERRGSGVRSTQHDRGRGSVSPIVDRAASRRRRRTIASTRPQRSERAAAPPGQSPLGACTDDAGRRDHTPGDLLPWMARPEAIRAP